MAPSAHPTGPDVPSFDYESKVRRAQLSSLGAAREVGAFAARLSVFNRVLLFRMLSALDDRGGRDTWAILRADSTTVGMAALVLLRNELAFLQNLESARPRLHQIGTAMVPDIRYWLAFVDSLDPNSMSALRCLPPGRAPINPHRSVLDGFAALSAAYKRWETNPARIDTAIGHSRLARLLRLSPGGSPHVWLARNHSHEALVSAVREIMNEALPPSGAWVGDVRRRVRRVAHIYRDPTFRIDVDEVRLGSGGFVLVVETGSIAEAHSASTGCVLPIEWPGFSRAFDDAGHEYVSQWLGGSAWRRGRWVIHRHEQGWFPGPSADVKAIYFRAIGAQLVRSKQVGGGCDGYRVMKDLGDLVWTADV